ncbi:hypothetical protein PDIP_85680 [Penicillium digitatum Pd1]|uniref:HTH psq-type domain-containing protein n=1 Tax=Penicillium digitatum (strain Pd1 / CECT 20795) TaxID=1170230 RepID=K9FQC5_PEND1|nr:hypothetical protein PDIP_85680 [Penicillium digitatum Pd1]EKV04923.1 hypothetical protein PDIP_85680 [Penicillium digitatum Pd1]
MVGQERLYLKRTKGVQIAKNDAKGCANSHSPKAVDSLSNQSKPNIAKTAREFAVSESRLRRRWKGGKSLFQRQPNGRKLTPR